MIGNRTIFLYALAVLSALIPILHAGHARGETPLDDLTFLVGVSGDQNGRRIDVSLDTAIIGGRFGGGSGEGTAQIFYRDPDSTAPLSDAWALTHTFTTTDLSLGEGDRFGDGVGIDQNLAVVGASDNNTVYVYRRQSTIEPWTPDAAPWFSMLGVDNFGIDVRVSVSPTERIIVGSTNNAAYIYTKQEGGWAGTALPASGTKSQFGSSVDISGTNAIVGDWGENTAHLYHQSGGNWVEEAAFSMPSGSFGESVAVFGDYAIVGAPAASNNMGLAVIYHRDAGIWTQQDVLIASDGMGGDPNGDWFGYSVDIGEDYAIVGALGGTSSEWTFGGAAYIFQRDGTTWTEVEKLVPAGDDGFIEFGSAVALDEGGEDAQIANVIVGAWRFDSDTGTAYAHELDLPSRQRIPGDADLDGDVDAADASIMASNWLKPSGAVWGEGDFDEDGDVDDRDATVLAANWQFGVDAASAASIPEPQSLLLLAIGAVCMGLARRRN